MPNVFLYKSLVWLISKFHYIASSVAAFPYFEVKRSANINDENIFFARRHFSCFNKHFK